MPRKYGKPGCKSVIHKQRTFRCRLGSEYSSKPWETMFPREVRRVLKEMGEMLNSYESFVMSGHNYNKSIHLLLDSGKCVSFTVGISTCARPDEFFIWREEDGPVKEEDVEALIRVLLSYEEADAALALPYIGSLPLESVLLFHSDWNEAPTPTNGEEIRTVGELYGNCRKLTDAFPERVRIDYRQEENTRHVYLDVNYRPHKHESWYDLSSDSEPESD